MSTPDTSPTRIHLFAHAGPAWKDIRRLGFTDAPALFSEIRRLLPAPYRLTASRRFFEVREDQRRGGRRDDAARLRDLQDALNDPTTRAIVAANGGAWFTRVLPHVDFDVLARRRAPLWAIGFSELTTLVNVVAQYRCGRGVYWLCPNYLARKLRPRRAARAAYAEFWRRLPELLGDRPRDRDRGEDDDEAGLGLLDARAGHRGGSMASARSGRAARRVARSGGADGQEGHVLPFRPIRGRLVAGRVEDGSLRVVGGCLSVLAAVLTGRVGRPIRPDGRWLAIEDVNEPPYRVDRYLAALKIAGWFDRIAGVLVGDFHTGRASQQPAVLELLRFHLLPARGLPIVATKDFGHVWPMSPLPINRPLRIWRRGNSVTIGD